MGYDRGDSFPSDFEPNGIPFVSKSRRKLVTTIISHSICKEIKYEFSQRTRSLRTLSTAILGVIGVIPINE